MKHWRVVIDTNVLVSALMTPTGKSAMVFRLFLTGEFTLVYSEEILDEYMTVLQRPRLRVQEEDVSTILSAIRQCGVLVAPTPSIEHMPDEDDRKFYDAAKSTDAYLVTGNARHYPNEQFIHSPASYLELFAKP